MGIRTWIARFFRTVPDEKIAQPQSSTQASDASPEQSDAAEEGAAEITNVPRGTRLRRGSSSPAQDSPTETS